MRGCPVSSWRGTVPEKISRIPWHCRLHFFSEEEGNLRFRNQLPWRWEGAAWHGLSQLCSWRSTWPWAGSGPTCTVTAVEHGSHPPTALSHTWPLHARKCSKPLISETRRIPVRRQQVETRTQTQTVQVRDPLFFQLGRSSEADGNTNNECFIIRKCGFP